MPDKRSDSKSAARSAAEKIVDKAEELADDLVGGADVVPGTPGSRPPTVDEPTEPTSPLPPKADQKGATPYGPTGAEPPGSVTAREEVMRQQGAFLTTGDAGAD